MADTCVVCKKGFAWYVDPSKVIVSGEATPVHFDCLQIFNRDPERYGGAGDGEADKIRSDSKILLQKRSDADLLRQKRIDNIRLTTAFAFVNHEIQDEVSIITAECVFGMNVFRDFFAGMTDFFGGRSDSSQKVLRDARETCLNELKKEAYALGADGVIGIDLDYSEISGKGKGMLFLVASGTAVKFREDNQ